LSHPPQDTGIFKEKQGQADQGGLKMKKNLILYVSNINLSVLPAFLAG
jgi:hypothetical protein